jgi:hypothetical protein
MTGYCLKKLGFGAALSAEAEDLNHRLGQIKSAWYVRGQAFEIDEISFDVLHRFAAGADQMVMGFEIAVHAQRGRMRSDLSQQPALDEKPQVVVNRGQRNRRNTAPHRRINILWRIVPMRSDDRLINHLPLMRDRQTVFGSQFAELVRGEVHDYRMRIIIKLPGTVFNRNLSFDPEEGKPQEILLDSEKAAK